MPSFIAVHLIWYFFRMPSRLPTWIKIGKQASVQSRATSFLKATAKETNMESNIVQNVTAIDE